MRLAMRMETSRYKSSVCALQISYHRSSAAKQSRLAPEIVSFNGWIQLNGENLGFSLCECAQYPEWNVVIDWAAVFSFPF